jgi:rSAM/selenodomain-associated transferase 1
LKSALIIFVRNPVLGKVKTRIAKDLGEHAALEVYNQLLAHTQSITKALDFDRFIFYADYLNGNDIWDNETYHKEIQSGNDLGERMYNAFELLFSKGYNKICIIGSDCLELTKEKIEEAFLVLEDNNAVIGPSLDGGYYLLGMSTFIKEVFKNKDWSTDTVYSDTVSDLLNNHLSYYTLPALSDVDNAEDCKRYSALLSLPDNQKL